MGLRLRRGGSGPSDSDLDLAGLFRVPPGVVALLDARADSVGREVDLVDLQQVSPVLAFQVLKRGRLVHELGPRRRLLFTAALIGRYEDVKRLREPIEHAALRRLHGRA